MENAYDTIFHIVMQDRKKSILKKEERRTTRCTERSRGEKKRGSACVLHGLSASSVLRSTFITVINPFFTCKPELHWERVQVYAPNVISAYLISDFSVICLPWHSLRPAVMIPAVPALELSGDWRICENINAVKHHNSLWNITLRLQILWSFIK